MDPYQNQRDAGNLPNYKGNTSGTSGSDQTPANPDRDAPGSRNPQPTDRQPQYSGGFTVIPPNESQRNKIKMMAQKEEEELQRWREAKRVPSVHLNPERLGGSTTLAGAREKQLTELRHSRLQKKLKKEELDKRRRQEEEEENQKMKAIQREKAERLEEKRRQEEQRRREQLRQDHVRKTESFLQRFEKSAPGPLASSSATHTSSRSEAKENEPRESRSLRDVQLEYRRVNSAFLDNLEAQGRRREKETTEEGVQECLSPGDSEQSNPPGHLNPDQEQSYSCWTEEAEPEPDYDWALMKLMNSFPAYSRVFLEDILDQCKGDYEQAHTLLYCPLN